MSQLGVECVEFRNHDADPQLRDVCSGWLEKISEMGPSDNQTQMSVKKSGRQFFVTVRMASLGLMFTLHASALSPYVAVDSAMKQALTKVQKWSAARKSPGLT